METEKVITGIVYKKGKPIACVIQGKESRKPEIYSLSEMSLDDVVELLNGAEGVTPIQSAFPISTTSDAPLNTGNQKTMKA